MLAALRTAKLFVENAKLKLVLSQSVCTSLASERSVIQNKRRCLRTTSYSTDYHCYSSVCFGDQRFAHRLNRGRTTRNRSIVKIRPSFFHTTPVKNALPPIFVFLLRPLFKLTAALLGRTLRVWWARLPLKEKQALIARYKENRTNIFRNLGFIFGAFATLLTFFYYTHLEPCPVTNRKRFIAFSKELIGQLADLEEQAFIKENREKILSTQNPLYEKLNKITRRILSANQDLQEVKNASWSVVVIQSELKNAFVLPNGTIFIFTGLLSICDNEDQLGVILAHEMTHAVLSHTAEQLSNEHMVELILLLPVFLIWALLPDRMAIVFHWLFNMMSATLVRLPFSRRLELEADRVGLQLAAKACFDVREAVVFWDKMGRNSQDAPGIFSTHPSHETRRRLINQLIPAAIKIREECKCSKLPEFDPRSNLESSKLRPAAVVRNDTEEV